MPAQASDYTDGTYYICETCKEGKFASTEQRSCDSDWMEFHSMHDIKMEIATRFLSVYLSDGYIDCDRPDMQPLILSFPGDTGLPKGTNYPTGAAGALDIQRRMRVGHVSEQATALEEDVERVQNDLQKVDRTTALFAPVAPSLKDMQVTLPWTVHYSRDFRANPESHKDFRHALGHMMKALGKLSAINDDFDHKRESEMSEKAKDYLADMVVCAMRAANTFPGGVIDLMAAVQNRVVSKNFTDVKKVDPD